MEKEAREEEEEEELNDWIKSGINGGRGRESREAGGRRCKIAGLIGRKWKIKKKETRVKVAWINR